MRNLAGQGHQGLDRLPQGSRVILFLAEKRVEGRKGGYRLIERGVAAFLISANANQIFRRRVGGKQSFSAVALSQGAPAADGRHQTADAIQN